MSEGVKKAKIIMKFTGGVQLSEDVTYEEMLEILRNAMENGSVAETKVKLSYFDGTEFSFEDAEEEETEEADGEA